LKFNPIDSSPKKLPGKVFTFYSLETGTPHTDNKFGIINVTNAPMVA